MRADLFVALGGFDDSCRLLFEDQTFFAKALAFAPAHVSDRTWAKYRQIAERTRREGLRCAIEVFSQRKKASRAASSSPAEAEIAEQLCGC